MSKLLNKSFIPTELTSLLGLVRKRDVIFSERNFGLAYLKVFKDIWGFQDDSNTGYPFPEPDSGEEYGSLASVSFASLIIYCHPARQQSGPTDYNCSINHLVMLLVANCTLILV